MRFIKHDYGNSSGTGNSVSELGYRKLPVNVICVHAVWSVQITADPVKIREMIQRFLLH